MTKKEARKLYKEKRLSLTGSNRDKLEDLMLIEFQRLDVPIPDNIMTFAPNEKLLEYNPSLIERYCSFRNLSVRFAYPKLAGETLQAILVDETTTFSENKFGIEEPEGDIFIDPAEINMVFMPLLAFDKRGFRVGYGKGYYDRFLSASRPDLLKIGFSFFEAEDMIEDINEFDIALDICITPYKTYHFN